MNDEVLAGLNPEQLETALHRGHCLAIACPGSGKTKTLAAKAAFFLREGARVGAVTFTRDAAIELRERIVKAAGPGHQARLLVGTFHSIDMLMAFPNTRQSEFGAAILRDMRSPYKKPWKIVNDGVRKGYLLRAMAESGIGNLSFEEASRVIEEGKAGVSGALLEPTHKEMLSVYEQLMNRSGQIDFQDIILHTNKALLAGDMTPLKVDYLLIDEFQDTDHAQFQWAEMHAGAGIATTAVGDDDQSIYAFRRALGYSGLERFAEQFNAQRIMLGTNYRCHSEILSTSERLISCNRERIAKRLHAHKGPGGNAEWKRFRSPVEEAEESSEAARLAFSTGTSFAVIARTNRALDDVESALINNGTPFRRAEGSSIFNYPEVQVYLALLRSLSKPSVRDVDQVLAWAGMSEGDIAEIHRLFGNTIRMGAKGDFVDSRISDHGRDIWRSFADHHIKWSMNQKNTNFRMNRIGIKDWLLDHLKKPGNPKRIELIDRLLYDNDRVIEPRLKEVMEMERSRKEKASVPNAVALITAHGSKGLEYDRVWIIRAEEGMFPDEESSLEEERRLMFVAMTRAKEKLWISSTDEKLPSVFLKECGLHT